MRLGPVILDVASTILSKEDREVLLHPQVGGVILFSRNYENPAQVRALIHEIKSLRESPLWVAVDQEGGRVQRFKNGVTRLPPLKPLGDLYDTDPQKALHLAQDHAWVMASEMLSLGVDHSFAPVLDLNKGISEVIGDRSFHKDPFKVYQLASAYIKGMHQAGMSACGKHFPGHGSVEADSHLALPVDDRSFNAIFHEDMQPFIHLMKDNLLEAMMPAHIIFRDVDTYPVGFSRRWLREILQKDLNFKGVIISDDLSMEAASEIGDYAARAHCALEAGCHALLVCNNRKGALSVLESLEGNYKNTGELQRLYGKRTCDSLDALKVNLEYQQKVAAISALNIV